MGYMFLFEGGPLDGNALSGDEAFHGKEGWDCAEDAFRDAEGGKLGKQFTVINPDTPRDERGTVWELRRHVYEVTKTEVSRKGGRVFIHAKYVKPLPLVRPPIHRQQ